MGPDGIAASIQVVAGGLGHSWPGARWLEAAEERACFVRGSLLNNRKSSNNPNNSASFSLPGLYLASAGLLPEPAPGRAVVVLQGRAVVVLNLEQAGADVVISGGGFAEITDLSSGVR